MRPSSKRVLVASLVSAAVVCPPTARAQQGLLSERPTVWVDPVRDLAPDAAASPIISKILFVDRCEGGCTIAPGFNDARHNTSSIPSETSYLSEFAHGDEVFEAVIECVREVYAPYLVFIVTNDPGAEVFHHKAIVAGRPEEIGRGSNIGGIAPTSCQPLNNVISFTFANAIGPDVETLCWTIAQESAHSFGLPNHVFDCQDPMTYLEGCGRKYFRNRDMPCGETAPNEPPCVCGRPTWNSHQVLRGVFGDGAPSPPPEVEILGPADGASVEEGFSVRVHAQDRRLVDRLELYVNGWPYQKVEGHGHDDRLSPYELTAPTLPDGYLDVEVRAYNDLGGEGAASRRYLKGAPCASDDDCFDHQECVGGACRYPPPTGELGDECDHHGSCKTALCSAIEGDRRCSQRCERGAAGGCPQGFECVESGGESACWPERSPGGGCRTVPRDFPGSWMLALLLAAAMLGRAAGRRARALDRDR